MAIFDEPSRQPLPHPTFEDVKHSVGKGLASMIPFVGGAGSELIGLLSSPVAQRRDDWFEDLARAFTISKVKWLGLSLILSEQ